MIRVLQVVTHMNRGGLETMIMNYYRNIDRTQIQFDFLTHRDYDGDYGKEIVSMGGKIYHLPILNPFGRKYKKNLAEFFDLHPEYRIIHVHQDCMSSVILKIAKKKDIAVRIAHSHSTSQDKNLKYLVKMYYRRQIPNFSTHLFACSVAAGKWMFGDHKFEVLNNAIDAEKFRFNEQKRTIIRGRMQIQEEELLVGHVGRFCYPKNHSFLIDIFNTIRNRIPSKLILVGDGELKKDIEQKVKEYGLEDKVIFTGVISDVSDIMQAMDVFVFPSNYEGLPVTLIEAQAAGLPCLISDRVPLECRITDLVRQIPLADSSKEWADHVIKLSKTDRRNTFLEIRNAGFDIIENAKFLQNFYYSCANGGNGECHC